MKEENKIIFAKTAITPVLKGLLPTDFVNVSPQPIFKTKRENLENFSFASRYFKEHDKELITQE